jgi:hypothetical protein
VGRNGSVSLCSVRRRLHAPSGVVLRSYGARPLAGRFVVGFRGRVFFEGRQRGGSQRRGFGSTGCVGGWTRQGRRHGCRNSGRGLQVQARRRLRGPGPIASLQRQDERVRAGPPVQRHHGLFQAGSGRLLLHGWLWLPLRERVQHGRLRRCLSPPTRGVRSLHGRQPVRH